MIPLSYHSLQVNSGIIDGNGSVITLISENLVVSDKTLRLGGLEMADATYTYVDSTGVVTVAATGHGYASGSTHFVLIIDPADPDDIRDVFMKSLMLMITLSHSL